MSEMFENQGHARKEAAKRSRSGCLPCRKRKRKCDGVRPVCLRCQSRQDTCVWGVKASFHPSRTLQLSVKDTEALEIIEEQRRKDRTQAPGACVANVSLRAEPEIIDDTATIVQSFQREIQVNSSDSDCSDLDSQSGDHGQVISSTPVSQISQTHRRVEYEEEFSPSSHPVFESLATEASTGSQPEVLGPIRNIGTDSSQANILFDLFSGDSLSGALGGSFSFRKSASSCLSLTLEPEFPTSQQSKVDLLSAYVRETATWCETTDSQMNFSVKLAHYMFNSKPYVAAAMALASHQRDSLRRKSSDMTLELYQHAIRLLIKHSSGPADPLILATCTVLCVYEMMASTVSEWRRHLKGCADLLKTYGWNGNSDGVIKTCFWAFARIDVWAAFCIHQTTLIPTNSWVTDDSLERVAAKEDIDDYCNLAILFFARIINMLNTYRRKVSSDITFSESVEKAWERLRRWRKMRPTRVQPLLRNDKSHHGVFPTIIFSHSAANCGNTFYHAGSILLLWTGLVQEGQKISPEMEETDLIWHAKELGGISMSNPSHSNWVNHLQPLYIVGQVLGGVYRQSPATAHTNETIYAQRPGPQSLPSESYNMYTDQSQFRGQVGSLTDSGNSGTGSSHGIDGITGSSPEYAQEKIALLKHLARIEKATGWKTSERARDLRILWGLEY